MTLCFILNSLFVVKLVDNVAAMTLGEMIEKKKDWNVIGYFYH
jgi:hypothetical protein